MFEAHDCGFDDVRMPHDGVLDVKGGDPFTTGLDDVLGTIRDLDVPIGGDLADIARPQPSVDERIPRARIVVVLGSDPWSSDQEFTERFPIVGEWVKVLINDLDLQAWNGPSSGLEHIELIFPRPILHPWLQCGYRSHRIRFGHAPALYDTHACVLLEPVDHRARNCRTSTEEVADVRNVDVGMRLEVLLDPEPHRWHSG